MAVPTSNDETSDALQSEAGKARTRALARILGETGLQAIQTTQYRRAVETAWPLAEALGMASVTIPTADLDALATRLRSLLSGGAGLAASHTDQLPLIGESWV